jgi:hypothetical protein
MHRIWKPVVLPASANSKLSEQSNENTEPKDLPPSAAFDLWREQQVLHSNSFTREFQARKLMRQFLSKTHNLGSPGPPIMVVSHRFCVNVVSTDARYVAGFTLAQGHSVRLLAPDSVTWDKSMCSSSVQLSEGGK